MTARHLMTTPQLFEVTPAADAGLWESEDVARASDFQARAGAAGADFKLKAIARLQEAGGRVVCRRHHRCGFSVDAEVAGANGQRFLVLARGTQDDTKTAGLRRIDTVQKVGFVATHLSVEQRLPILIMTSHLPPRSSTAGNQLAKLGPYVADVIATTGDFRGYQRLLTLLQDGSKGTGPALWRDTVGSNQLTLAF